MRARYNYGRFHQRLHEADEQHFKSKRNYALLLLYRQLLQTLNLCLITGLREAPAAGGGTI